MRPLPTQLAIVVPCFSEESVLEESCARLTALMARLLDAGSITAGSRVYFVDDGRDDADDLRAVETMIEHFENDCDVVYGVRRRRDGDGAFKRASARFFYRVMTALGARTIHDHADFRLMSRSAVEALRGFREANLFLRGIVPCSASAPRSSNTTVCRAGRGARNTRSDGCSRLRSTASRRFPSCRCASSACSA